MIRILYITSVLLINISVSAQTKLMMIGGGKRTTDVLEKFTLETKGDKILIITWASGEPDASFEATKSDFEKVTTKEIFMAAISPLDSKKEEEFLKQLQDASAVYFTGGDQNKITKVLENITLKKALIDKYRKGYIFGGTSAGTAIMSEVMLTGKADLKVIDPEKVETSKGLGLVKHMIVDQHFIKRQRQNRLLSLLTKHKGLYGVGIDEDTALYLENGKSAKVYGDSQIMIFKPKKRAFETLILKKGDTYTFK